ncbi:MAG TPA: HAD-IA family hydrolase [Patescibacteria group bacterium]|nr:HAD-IA family hydrolase [Patescibacteria group bacterium]
MKKLENYLKKNPKTHLIFDLDETIIKLVLPWDEWFVDVLGKIRQTYRDFPETEYVRIHNGLVEHYGEEGLALIRELNERFENEKLFRIERNEELIDFIKNNPNYTYYLWTSNSGKTAKRFLEELGLDQIFKKVVTRSDSTFIKPHTQGFDLLKDSKTSISDYLFVGDSSRDKEAAKALEMDFFLIDYFHGTF